MFTKAKEIQPSHQNSYYNLALIRRAQGLDENAIELLLKVLDLNPSHNEAKLNAERICNELGIKFNKEREYELALKYFNILTYLEPSGSTGFYNMGNTYMELEDYKSAEDFFKKALDLDPKYDLAHSNLGAVYHKLGKLKKSPNPTRRL